MRCRPKHTYSLLRVLAETIGLAYIETVLETFVSLPRSFYLVSYCVCVYRSTARLELADPRLEPSMQPLAVLGSVDLICHLWQQYVNLALFPLASTSVTIRRDMVVYNNQTVSRIEGAANAFVQRLVDGELSLRLFGVYN